MHFHTCFYPYSCNQMEREHQFTVYIRSGKISSVGEYFQCDDGVLQ